MQKTQIKTPQISRRSFLKKTAVAGAAAGVAGGLFSGLILPAAWLRGAERATQAPSNRLNVAVVGLGGQGITDLRGVKNAGATIYALCDVHAERLEHVRAGISPKDENDNIIAASEFPAARALADYRQLFDKFGNDLDAVIVATPDHAHFTVALDAIRRGKHVYVQKPMCHSVDQVRRLAVAASEAKIVSSMGNQGHSSSHIRMVREWYEAGLFGKIEKVDCWDGQFKAAPKRYAAPVPVPDYLNWDLWLGPAKMRPYSPGIINNWRTFYEFGCGSLGDMAAHIIDPAYYILGLDYPEKIEILEREDFSEIGYPSHAKIAYHFAAKNGRPPVKLIWWHGKDFRPTPPDGLEYKEFSERKDDENLPDNPTQTLHPGVAGWLGKKRADGLTLNGSFLYGEKVTAYMGQYGDFFYTAPQSAFAQLRKKAPARKYPRYKGGHYKNWVECIRKTVAGNPTKAVSDFDYAAPLTETILLGNIALRLGRNLRYDAAQRRFINDDDANALLVDPPARSGFAA